jgi:hypothetical protein
LERPTSPESCVILIVPEGCAVAAVAPWFRSAGQKIVLAPGQDTGSFWH